MEVEQLAIPKKEAEENYQTLMQAFRQNTKLRKEEIRQDFRKVYGHMRHGKKIIDIFESFKKAGLNKDGDPRLAICRADSRQVLCEKISDGSARYYHDNGQTRPKFDSWQFRRRIRGDEHDIDFPPHTFEWKKDEYNQRPKNERITTIVPIIPAKILVTEVKALLPNYHILWEVEEWKPTPPKDPILVKRLIPNLFGVLATWDLTPIERAIIRGRLR